MPRFKHIEDLVTKPHAQPCAHAGCTQAGEHRAPVSKHQLHDYQWLCNQHIVEFNKRWDYFNGMSQEEIEHFQKDASFGHRPTWKTNESERHAAEKLHAALNHFMGARADFSPIAPPLHPKDKLALADLDLDHPCSRDDIKTQYKKLVKKYHPDRNPNDKHAEERFKQIALSYQRLIQHYCEAMK